MQYPFREGPTEPSVDLRREPPVAWLGPLLAFSLVFWGGIAYAIYRSWS